jgi:hypothetical protein
MLSLLGFAFKNLRSQVWRECQQVKPPTFTKAKQAINDARRQVSVVCWRSCCPHATFNFS